MERPTLVLTQFNLKPPPHWNVPDRSLDPGWIEYRLKLMNNTASKSLASQTDMGVVHVLFVNPRTDSEHRQQLTDSGLDWRVELVDVDEFDGAHYGELLADIFDGEEWLTIRLDSDDMLGCTYVETAKQFDEIGVYCFEDGVYFDEREKRGYRRRYRNNPLLFRVAKRGTSILDEGHHLISVDYSMRTTRPMWMQFHHSSNVSPPYFGIRPVKPNHLLEHFNLDRRLVGPDLGLASPAMIWLRIRLIARRSFSVLRSSGSRLTRVTGRVLRGQPIRLK